MTHPDGTPVFTASAAQRQERLAGMQPRWQRWTPLCQQCWQEAEPGQYCPPLRHYALCAVCAEDTLVVYAHPETARAAYEAYTAPVRNTEPTPSWDR